MTNADRIRSMSNSELSTFLDAVSMGDIDFSKTFCDLCKGQYDCDDCRDWWLEQDANAYNGLNRYGYLGGEEQQ